MKRFTLEQPALFTKDMKATHTILVPQMLPIHFAIMKSVLVDSGYRVDIIDQAGTEIAQTGLRYVHNDTCYPALLIIGQLISTLQSGAYDLDHVALMIPQSGGGCRASNYIHLLRKALHKAGLEHIPVISFNMNLGGKNGIESAPGFTLSPMLLVKLAAAMIFGDELMSLGNQVRPYEASEGETDKVLNQWIEEINTLLRRNYGYWPWQMKRLATRIAQSFAAIAVRDVQRTKVGVVGEIYVRYSSLGNNGLEEFLQNQDCECCIPGVLGYLMFSVDMRLEDIRAYGGSSLKYAAINGCLSYLAWIENMLISAIGQTSLQPPTPYQHKRELVDGIIGHGSKMGEGWMLTAEMLELIEQGYSNIVCAQPFGCLPNHINGRGMMNRVKEVQPQANIVAVDYDPGAPRVNQENRIMLMLAGARQEVGSRQEEQQANRAELFAEALRRQQERLKKIPELLSNPVLNSLHGDNSSDE